MALAQLENKAVITVEEAADLLTIGRTSAYEAIRRGELPSLKIGRRIVVPVAPLMHMLGMGTTTTGENL